MELIIGKTYQIKRTQSAYYGRKAKTIWINGIYIGKDSNWCTFDVGSGKEISIDADDVDKKVKELKE